jgi:hypothetical protein
MNLGKLRRKMLLFAVVFLFLTIYYAVKGIFSGIGDIQNKQTHKKRAIYLTVSIFCGLASLEFYEPNTGGLICLPILIMFIWIQYSMAILFLPKK